jgi:TRAP-type mannitol/chloroaromatic compound transport system substrate-binding protein
MVAPEASGWFRKEVKSVEDLRGLKMRFLGLGARVIEKFGVSTQLLVPGDIYPALELGTIDATEFSMPVIDEGLGFHQIAKHNYYPGWHQQGTLLDVIVHKPKYDALSEYHKNVLRIACESNLLTTFVESEAAQFGAMGRMKEKGVTMHRWPEEILATFEKAWAEVVEAEAARDADFKRVYESYASFREQYAVWREMGYVN